MQVLKGDLKPAVETHEMLYQVMQKHNFIPEAFTTDFQVIKFEYLKTYIGWLVSVVTNLPSNCALLRTAIKIISQTKII